MLRLKYLKLIIYNAFIFVKLTIDKLILHLKLFLVNKNLFLK